MNSNIFSGACCPFKYLLCRAVFSDHSHPLKFRCVIPPLRLKCKPHRSCARSGPAHAFSPHPLCSGHNVPKAASRSPLKSFAWAVSSCLSGVYLSQAFLVISVSRATTPGPFLAHLKVPFHHFFFLISIKSWKNWAPHVTTPVITV